MLRDINENKNNNNAHQKGGETMYEVKTFGMEIRPMKTMQELKELDDMVNAFISENNVKRVVSVSDVPTTDDTGETIGLIRVLCYEV